MLYTKQKENNFFVKTSKIATLDKVQNFELNRKSQLNNIIKNADGSPDYLAINIYYDTLRSWYTPNKLKTSNSKILEVAKLKTRELGKNVRKCGIRLYHICYMLYRGCFL